jgi:hypothetical protein
MKIEKVPNLLILEYPMFLVTEKQLEILRECELKFVEKDPTSDYFFLCLVIRDLRNKEYPNSQYFGIGNPYTDLTKRIAASLNPNRTISYHNVHRLDDFFSQLGPMTPKRPVQHMLRRIWITKLIAYNEEKQRLATL